MKPLLSSSSKYIFKSPYKRGNNVAWIQSGKAYFDLLEKLIDSARQEIHLQTYIFASDETGNKIADALIRAAKRKIQVFLLVDAFGSKDLSAQTIQSFKNAGIHYREFGRFFSHGTMHIGRRMHHKITVIDGQISIVGGINISNNYNAIHGTIPWLDFAVILKGNISSRIRFICLKRWKNKIKTVHDKRKFLLFPTLLAAKGSSPVRVRRNDFTLNKFEISISYREAIRSSKNSILLVGGYFLPGGRTRRLLKKAIERGVDICVIVSEQSDVTLVVNARRYLYQWLLRNKINVYEYQPSNVHGKVLISDNKWTSIGSYDMNNLSTYSNIELNVDIKDELFSANLSNHIHSIREKDCKKINREDFQKKSTVFYKLKLWFSYRIVKTFFVLSALLAGNAEGEK